jgi:hypothetical protein
MQLMSVFSSRLPERSERELRAIEREMERARALLRWYEHQAGVPHASPRQRHATVGPTRAEGGGGRAG